MMNLVLKTISGIVSAGIILCTLFSCSSDSDGGSRLRLTADKTALHANGIERAVFTVRYGAGDVTRQAKITELSSGRAVADGTFCSETPGEYSFRAEYDGVVSDPVTVRVAPLPGYGLTLEADKTSVGADGETVTFSVRKYDETGGAGVDVTGQATITLVNDGSRLESGKFTCTTAGIYVFRASWNEAVSEETVVVGGDAEFSLLLTADREYIKSDGTQQALFSVRTRDGQDVTQSAVIRNITARRNLEGNGFASEAEGVFEFRATYMGMPSDIFRVVATESGQPDYELTLSVDRNRITNDLTDCAAFTVTTKDGEDVTQTAVIRNLTDGEDLDGSEFRSDRTGRFEFQAFYMGSESNLVTVNVGSGLNTTALELRADRLIIAPDGVDRATFSVTVKDNDITFDPGVKLYMRGGAPVERDGDGGFSFSTTEDGAYEFRASYGDDFTEFITVWTDDTDPAITGNFYRGTMLAVFTSTSGASSTLLIEHLGEALAAYPDRTAVMNIHCGDAVTPDQSFADAFRAELAADARFAALGGGGFAPPAVIADLRSHYTGWADDDADTPAMLRSLVEDYPATTGFRYKAMGTMRDVAVRVTVGSASAGDCRLGVALLESGVRAGQNGMGTINHDNVLREMISEGMFGDDLGTIAAGGSVSRSYIFDILPEKRAGMSLLFYTVRPDDQGRPVVDNAAVFPLNGSHGYRYE